MVIQFGSVRCLKILILFFNQKPIYITPILIWKCKNNNCIYFEELNEKKFFSKFNNNKVKNKNEIDDYMKIVINDHSIDPHFWWINNTHTFPLLSLLARKNFSVIESSVFVERLISKILETITRKRTKLSANVIEV